MSATELDLPLLPSAGQIRRREFATIRRGYDPDQVREYLRDVASQVETLEGELRESRIEAQNATVASDPVVVPEPEQPDTEPQPDPYEQLAEHLSGLMRSADGEAERIVQEAQDEATRMMTEARTEADRIRLDAQARAEEARTEGAQFLTQAKVEADKVLSGLASRREGLVEQLQTMQSRLLGVAKELETAIGREEQADASVQARRAGPNPSYEDLWVSSADDVLPEMGPLDLDFDQDTEG